MQQPTDSPGRSEQQWIQLFAELDSDKTERSFSSRATKEQVGFLDRLEQARQQITALDGYISQLQAAVAQTDGQINSPAIQDSGFRLPEIELCSFNGSSTEWPIFWDWSQDSVDSQPLSDAEKLAYFNSFMQGPAKQLVEAY